MISLFEKWLVQSRFYRVWWRRYAARIFLEFSDIESCSRNRVAGDRYRTGAGCNLARRTH